MLRKGLGKQGKIGGIAAVASRQHSLITSLELRELGLDDQAVRRRIASGLLFPKGAGVFAVGQPRLTDHGKLMLASLSYHPLATVSHRSAASLHAILPTRRGPVDVIAQVSHQRAGTTRHRLTLGQRDRTYRHGIPVTALARTLADLAADPLVEKAINEAQVRNLLTPSLIRRALALVRNRAGAERLHELLAPVDPSHRLRSDLERRFLRLLDQTTLGRPKTNVPVEVEDLLPEIDAVWPSLRLAVELDGAATHLTRRQWELDHDRDARLRLAGWVVQRFTDRQVEETPYLVIQTLEALAAPPAMMRR